MNNATRQTRSIMLDCICLMAALLLDACGNTPGSPAPSQTPPTMQEPATLSAQGVIGGGGRIAFLTQDTGSWTISALRSADGVPALVKDGFAYGRPVWSPDGARIAYSSGDHIWVMDANGEHLVDLAPGENPDWAPDGKRIAFDHYDYHTGDTQIYVINVDGSGLTALTEGQGARDFPKWSPDGTRIAFTQEYSTIHVMDADGRNVIALENGTRPAWSPDGSKLAFNFDSYRIAIVDVNGGGTVAVTDGAARDSDPVWSPGGEKIAFTSTRDGREAIYVMNADTSDQTRLTRDTSVNDNPAWSPDGSRIAFEGQRNNKYQIYIANNDGSGLTELTYGDQESRYPVWQPAPNPVLTARPGFTASAVARGPIPVDTATPTALPIPPNEMHGRLAFASIRNEPSFPKCQAGGCNADLFVMGLDGSDLTQLTFNKSNDYNPVWSPDGNMIAFVSNRTGNNDIFLIGADGRGLLNLTDNLASDSGPSWSADGKQIRFSSNRDGRWQIYTMNTDGSGQKRLADTPTDIFGATWSPDSSQLVYWSIDEPSIYIMDSVGNHQMLITDKIVPYSTIAWSPDGKQLVLDSLRDGDTQIYTINIDGSGITRITNDPDRGTEPAWSPDGRMILFHRETLTGVSGLFVMRTDGSSLTAVQGSTEGDFSPAWGP